MVKVLVQTWSPGPAYKPGVLCECLGSQEEEAGQVSLFKVILSSIGSLGL